MAKSFIDVLFRIDKDSEDELQRARERAEDPVTVPVQMHYTGDNAAAQAAVSSLTTYTNSADAALTGAGTEFKEDRDKANAAHANVAQTRVQESINATRHLSIFDRLAGVKEDSTDEEAHAKRVAKGVQLGTAGFQQAIGITTSLMRNTFGIIEDIYAKMKEASPLLQTIESLINLGVQMVLLPIGNALGEELLPMTVDMLEAVLNMWDDLDAAFAEGGLDAMMTKAMTKGVDIITTYMLNIGTTLSKHTGILGGIGNLITTVADFLKGNGLSTLNALLKVFNFVLNHMKTLIALVSAFYAAYLTIQIASALDLFGTHFGGALAATGVAAVTTGAVVYGVGSYLENEGKKDLQYNDTGGWVPHTEGGSFHIVGETENELIIPESKVGALSGHVTIINNYYGFGERELMSKVEDVISTQISQARYRGGF